MVGGLGGVGGGVKGVRLHDSRLFKTFRVLFTFANFGANMDGQHFCGFKVKRSALARVGGMYLFCGVSAGSLLFGVFALSGESLVKLPQAGCWFMTFKYRGYLSKKGGEKSSFKFRLN